MSSSLRAETHAVLSRHGLTLSKLRGQHLLVDVATLERILAAAELTPGMAVLEIGPGTGTLTARLLAAGARVTAVELDRRMAEVLRARFAGEPRFTLIVGDALAVLEKGGRMGPPLHLPPGFIVVANLPYQITTPLLWTLLGPDVPAARLPQSLTVLVQREVAERMLAGSAALPAGRQARLNLLALLMQSYGPGRRIALVPPGAFLPPPRVSSAVVRFAAEPLPDRARLLSLARAGFAAPRRTLAGNLAAAGRSRTAVASVLRAAGLPAAVRAEALTLADWQSVAAAL